MQHANLLELLINNKQNKDVIYNRTVMFAFTARSGSTAITDAIGNMGLAKKVDEIFNLRGPVQNIYKNYGESRDIVDYVNNVYKKKMLADVLIFKTDFKDLALVMRQYDIFSLFPNLKIVYIERKDKVMQAVSLYKATVTKHWHQLDDINTIAIPENFSPNIKKIILLKKQLEGDCEKWRQHFRHIGAKPYTLYYEDFDHAPEQTLNDIFKFIENHNYNGEIALNYKKLRDEVSDEWARLVRHQLINSS